jgi:F-type H+-transporting ATPase subunit g
MANSARSFSSSLRALRQPSRTLGRRFASTSREDVEKKAAESLASAKEQAGKAWESTRKVVGPLGDRVASMLGCKYYASKTTFISARKPSRRG